MCDIQYDFWKFYFNSLKYKAHGFVDPWNLLNRLDNKIFFAVLPLSFLGFSGDRYNYSKSYIIVYVLNNAYHVEVAVGGSVINAATMFCFF